MGSKIYTPFPKPGAAAGVNTFNGRNGTVVPVAGDYAGNLLATQQYAPAGGASYSLTGSLAALDTTNATISFTAPSNGRVMIVAEFDLNVAEVSAVTAAYFCLFTHSTSTVVGYVTRALAAQTASLNFITRAHVTFFLTGVTAGATQYDLAGAFTGGTGSASVNVQGVSTLVGGDASPLILQAYAG